MEIDRLYRVPLREVWKNEAYDFTQWLETNSDILSEAIDLNLVNVEREKKTESTFSVDLVAEDEETGGTVVIENQLEKSDHDHLGKLITYLTAMQATDAIWIVAKPRPEHVAAVNWLNESTSANFYLIKIEAVVIGDSQPAPLFTVIVGPSEEGKSVGLTKQAKNERQKLRLEWWTQLLQQPKAIHHKHITPSKYSWLGGSSGVSGVGFNYIVLQSSSGIEVYIDRGKERGAENTAIFNFIYDHKQSIEEKSNLPLEWEVLEGKRACRIKYMIEGGYRGDSQEWSVVHEKLADSMHRFHEAISPLLKSKKFKDLLAAETAVEEGA